MQSFEDFTIGEPSDRRHNLMLRRDQVINDDVVNVGEMRFKFHFLQRRWRLDVLDVHDSK